MTRGVSTVADVALALVLIGAAVLTLAVVVEERPDGAGRADAAAETVAATTASVEYSLRPLVESPSFPDGEYDENRLWRVSQGSTGGLLADAAVANVRVDGERLAEGGRDYERAVATAVDERLRTATRGVEYEVVAVWRPYEGAPVEGRATAGEPPPTDADVSTAVTTVPSGLPAARADAIEGRGYEEVAEAAARAAVDGLVPPSESRRALEGDGLERAVVVHRYERLAALLDGDEEAVAEHLADANATAASAELVERLTARFAADLERSFDDPDAAARAVSTGETTLVVSVWRP